MVNFYTVFFNIFFLKSKERLYVHYKVERLQIREYVCLMIKNYYVR